MLAECKFIVIYCNQALYSDVKQYNYFSARRWFASMTTTEWQGFPGMTLCKSDLHKQQHTGRADCCGIILYWVFGKAHSKLHGSVMQVIMTQILTLTVTQISGHCRRRSAEDGTSRWVVCITIGRAGMVSWQIACNILGGPYSETKYKAC